jgi:hypothetical protein
MLGFRCSLGRPRLSQSRSMIEWAHPSLPETRRCASASHSTGAVQWRCPLLRRRLPPLPASTPARCSFLQVIELLYLLRLLLQRASVSRAEGSGLRPVPGAMKGCQCPNGVSAASWNRYKRMSTAPVGRRQASAPRAARDPSAAAPAVGGSTAPGLITFDRNSMVRSSEAGQAGEGSRAPPIAGARALSTPHAVPTLPRAGFHGCRHSAARRQAYRGAARCACGTTRGRHGARIWQGNNLRLMPQSKHKQPRARPPRLAPTPPPPTPHPRPCAPSPASKALATTPPTTSAPSAPTRRASPRSCGAAAGTWRCWT